jgi:hypothetical protein
MIPRWSGHSSDLIGRIIKVFIRESDSRNAEAVAHITFIDFVPDFHCRYELGLDLTHKAILIQS